MSRPGITYDDVARAATQLTADGKNPTIERIRALTGTGSSSTLAQHLKRWKAEQDTTSLLATQEQLPDALIAMMKGLWSRVQEEAQNQVATLKRHFDTVKAELQHQLAQHQHAHTALQEQVQQLQDDKHTLLTQVSTLEQTLRQLQDDKIASTLSQQHLSQQLHDAHRRSEELHRLTEQAQANLEHYRESVREQRFIEQERAAEQKRTLEHQLQQGQQELRALHHTHSHVQKESHQLQVKHDVLQTQFDKLTTHLATREKYLVHLEKSVSELAYVKTHCEALQQQCTNHLQHWMTAKAEVTHLTQALATRDTELAHATSHNQHLVQETKRLTQENAQLIEQLKQQEIEA